MSRKKRTSAILETARRRLAGLKSVSATQDFGGGLTAASYETELNAVSDKLDSYNQQLSSIDQTLNELQDLEKGLREKNGRILSATKAHFGADSSEYEQVGGTRTSERKRPGPKKSGKGEPTT